MATIPITFTINIPVESLQQAITEAIQQGMGAGTQSKKYVTRKEASAILKFSTAKISRMCQSGQIEHLMVNDEYRILVVDGEIHIKPKMQLAKVG